MRQKKKVIFLRDHKKRVDTDPRSTTHKGIAGLYELALRRFKTLIYIMTIIPIYIMGSLFIGIALVPGIFVFHWSSSLAGEWPLIGQYFVKGTAIATGFFLFGFSLILLVPLANFLLRTSPKVFRGPYYSVDFFQWYVHNALTYLVRYTFLEFITPTPFNILFYSLMGMKIGKGTQINTSFISDPALIQMGRKVTIGGSATICAHYGMGGYLILAPVVIEDEVTVGLKASIMGGVKIGKGAKILPHSAVLPKTVIGAGETWGGVPAQKIKVKAA